MSARNPEEICRLFQQSMAAGDEVKTGEAGLKEVLAPLAAAQARFDYNIRQII